MVFTSLAGVAKKGVGVVSARRGRPNESLQSPEGSACHFKSWNSEIRVIFTSFGRSGIKKASGWPGYLLSGREAQEVSKNLKD